MKFVNVRELKNKTSAILRLTRNGEDVIVTLRGKPCAMIRQLSEDDIEDYILLNHPHFKKKFKTKKSRRKRMITEKFARLPDSGSFDSQFWRQQGTQARFAATWKTIEEFYKIRGINGYKFRLQRSVQNIKQA